MASGQTARPFRFASSPCGRVTSKRLMFCSPSWRRMRIVRGDLAPATGLATPGLQGGVEAPAARQFSSISIGASTTTGSGEAQEVSSVRVL